jgi:hypothetical protein
MIIRVGFIIASPNFFDVHIASTWYVINVSATATYIAVLCSPMQSWQSYMSAFNEDRTFGQYNPNVGAIQSVEQIKAARSASKIFLIAVTPRQRIPY